jgi:mannose/cellobiose epimerase-like protein (N-acyl-D-glucosamine 2-epimerase family)
MPSRAASRAAVIATQDRLLRWLLDVALPVWDQHGVDRRSGGYFEDVVFLDPQRAYQASGALRRGRVVARQIFVFDVARRLGWQSPTGSPVAHGGDYLFSRLHRGDGYFHTAVDATTHRAQSPFSLYEQAFYLFALARLNATLANRYPIVDTAVQCLARLRRDYGRSEGGFEESSPPTLPLKSNPHMHLLEAALEWIGVSAGGVQQRWIELAREIVGLCLSRFCDSLSGAIREYFDDRWRPLADDAGRVVEPGHQFEWAWLLMQWSSLACCGVAERRACMVAAVRLIEIGEKWGVDPVRGVAINEIWDDMSPKQAAAKLWPQTERVKAWCAMMERAANVADTEHACAKIVSAAAGMSKYLRADAPGLWYESILETGAMQIGPSKASSFYHVVSAIDVLRKAASPSGGLRHAISHAGRHL